MLHLGTLREMLAFTDWANDRLFSSAAAIGDDGLDRPFDMGMGNLRKTLIHLYNGEFVWTERARGRIETPWPSEDERVTAPALLERLMASRCTRDAFVNTLDDAAMGREQRYRDSRGGLFRATLSDMWMQLCVHSMHHRAQTLNMLRHTGGALPKPGADYIFMRLERAERRNQLSGAADPRAAAPTDDIPPIDIDSLRGFFAYGDAAQTRLHAAAERLSDAQLDQPFEMGEGTLRGTLLHIRFAEQWWLENWTQGPGRPFPELPNETPVAQATELFMQTAKARNAFIAGLADADLKRIVEAHPRPNIVRRFPLGVTMLQICHHGVHHRAQGVNMLRRVGGEALEVDYMVSVRKPV
ncbi:MAG: DinB family protein [Phycisphaerae bacterium]